jgi:hypothetical protein
MINWHEAFVAALKLTFEEYKDALEFHDEVQLNTQPLRVDAVIIKKKPETVINKKIAAVFKTANILEYKSPGVSLSVDDFSKTLAYCLIYTVVERILITELSLSFIVNQRPREVLKYIREVYKWEVEEKWKGCHVVQGLPFKIQFIESRKLEEAEGLWLKEAHRKHSGESLKKVLEESRKYLKEEYMKVYLDILLKANTQGIEELTEMAGKTLDEVLTRAGLTAKWEARGRLKGRAEGEVWGEARGLKEALEMLRSGKTPQEIEKMYEEKRRLAKTTNGG